MEEGESLAQHEEAVRDWGNRVWEAKSSLEDHPQRLVSRRRRGNRHVNHVPDLRLPLMVWRAANDSLWLLDEANAADKHRLLIPAYAQLASTFVTSQVLFKLNEGPAALDDPVGHAFPLKESKIIFPVEDGTEIFRIHVTDPALNAPGQAMIDIVFGEGDAIKGQPIRPVAGSMIDAVDAVVQTYQSAGLLQ